MCFLLFTEPKQDRADFCSLTAIFHDLVHLTLANLWQIRHIPALLSISFLAFLFFYQSTSKCSAFTGPLSSSILSTCPIHRNLCSLRNSSNFSTLVISRIFLLFIISFKVFPHIIRKILISVVFIIFLYLPY